MRWLFVLFLFIPSAINANSLTVGTISFYPPFEIASDEQGQFSGFDVSIMSAICKRTRHRCQYKGMEFKDFFSALQQGEIDLAIGAISITPERQQKYLFSLPYYPSNMIFMALANSPYERHADISGVTIGLLSGDETEAVLKAQKLDAFHLKRYDLVRKMLQDLIDKKIDLVFTDAASAEYWVSNSTNQFKTIGHKINTGQGYGIMTLKKNSHLMQEINQALLALENDGTYLKIYSTFIGNGT